MAKMNLAGLLAAMVATELAFSKVSFELTSKGEKIGILHLTQPIENVQGSQFVEDDITGEKVRVEAFDVTQVKVSPDDQNGEGFELNPDGSGTYKGDFRLDVAKRTRETWLTSKPFNVVGREAVRANKAAANTGIADAIKKMKEQRGMVNSPAESTGKLNVVGETVDA